MVFRQTGLLRRVSTHPKDTRVWRLSVTSWSPELRPSLLALQFAFHFRLAQANGSSSCADPGSWLQGFCLARANGSGAFAWPRLLVPEPLPDPWIEMSLSWVVCQKHFEPMQTDEPKKGILNEVWIKPRYKPSDHLKNSPPNPPR